MRSHPASCLFCLCGADEAVFRSRVAALSALYAPLRDGVEVPWSPALGLGVGAIGFGGPAPVVREGGWLGHWGESALADARTVVEAGSAQLRALAGPAALIAVAGDRARIVTGASGPVSLYRCGDAYATHAVAAAVLAGERPRLDAGALPELFALGYVAGERTHLAGVAAVASATSVSIGPDGARAESYWPPAARWAPVAAAEAYEHAERALLASLERRLAEPAAPRLGLTAGLDSRVAAVALRELGVDFEAFTWGAGGGPDVDEARRVADALGVPHATLAGGWLDEEAALLARGREALWSDGLAPAPAFGAPEWPRAIDAYVTGGAGETGRAFYYRLSAAAAREPSVERVVGLWRPELEIRGAHEDAVRAVTEAKRGALAAAAACGHSGWALLDVVYGEERYRRWGRGMLARTPFPLVAAFAEAEVQRALASLALDDRLSDGFHRRFVAARRPGLVPPPGARQRRGVPPVARRLAARLRRARPGPWPLAGAWARHSRARAWIADDVLARPVFTEAMGEAWVASVRAGFLRDELRATEQALQAGGLAALQDAL